MKSSPFDRERMVAVGLAQEAGKAVLSWYGDGQEVHRKHHGELVTQADLVADRIITEGLAAHFPDDAVLSEETEDDLSRIDAERLWIVDPVDGTRELVDHTDHFVVMIALAVEGQPVVGAVYQPVGDRIWHAEVGVSALWKAGDGPSRPLRVGGRRAEDGVRLVMSRVHRFPGWEELPRQEGIASLQHIGSVGLKVAAIASDEADLYVHISKLTREWDTCAPDAILRAAGGRLTDLAGEPIRYNKPNLRNRRGILASNGRIHEWAIQLVRPFAERAGLL